MRQMPSGLIEEKYSMSTWFDGLGDLSQMQVHRYGVAAWQDECGSFAQSLADGAKDVGRSGALIRWRSGPCATSGPTAGDLVLLTDPGLVGEPNFYRGRLNAIFPRDVCHDRRETFLKRSIAPSAWA
jgi:hypothetical protein